MGFSVGKAFRKAISKPAKSFAKEFKEDIKTITNPKSLFSKEGLDASINLALSPFEAVGESASGFASGFANKPDELPIESPLAGIGEEEEIKRRKKLLEESQRRNAPGVRQQTVLNPLA